MYNFRTVFHNSAAERSGRKHGGQAGHKGCRLDIPKNLDALVGQGMAEHAILSDVADGEAYASDWTVDLKTIIVYTGYRRSPGKPPKIRYGPQIKTYAVYLSTIGLIVYGRLPQFFCGISHNLLKASKATLADFHYSATGEVIRYYYPLG